jgi:acid phosphatase
MGQITDHTTSNVNMSLFRVSLVSLALAGQATAVQFLAPTQDIDLPASQSATSPLQWLGANSPWFAGEI